MFASHGLHAEHALQHIGLDALHHGGEHVEPFALVLDQRIFLSVSAQADAVSQMVHAQQVIFPVVVDHLEQQHLLEVAHEFGAEFLLFVIVGLPDLSLNFLDHRIPADILEVIGDAALALGDVEGELSLQGFSETVVVPLFLVLIDWTVGLDEGIHQILHHVVNVLLDMLPARTACRCW